MVEMMAAILVIEVARQIISVVEFLRQIGVIVQRMELMILISQIMIEVKIEVGEVGKTSGMIIDNERLHLQEEMWVNRHLFHLAISRNHMDGTSPCRTVKLKVGLEASLGRIN
jgi:hypothetical protein